jgi:hypothetical protein
MLIETQCKQCHGEGGYDLIVGDEATPTKCDCSNGYRYLRVNDLDIQELIEEIELKGLELDKLNELYNQ